MGTNEGKTVKQRLILWSNRLRFDVRAQKKGWFVQIVLHERFKPFIRAVKIVLTLIGLISAFFSFQSVFVGFLFGLGIYLLSTFFEKLIFSYNSLYVHSLPDFEIQLEKWLGAFFGYAEDPNNLGHIPMVGWIMSNPEYAKRVHSLLLQWSYGKLKDEENNIRASVIVDDKDEYIFFCYPNMERKTAARFYEAVEKERKETSLTDVHHKQMAMLIFGKRCQITASSYFPTFRNRYKDGVPYIFQLVVLGGDGQPHAIDGLDDFILFNLKIKNRGELDRKDIEYDLLRILG
ncbi:MAG: hypothetical protein HZA47_07045 [Planctomycetes bacterium]|uniref:hypothetical protein n=1 Tax=Candidatus Wunengus sp. YC65 TaxID=3367701 RepID=UPI001DF3428C|nr:hypothetical protein [Planctomycetota bacterium]